MNSVILNFIIVIIIILMFKTLQNDIKVIYEKLYWINRSNKKILSLLESMYESQKMMEDDCK